MTVRVLDGDRSCLAGVPQPDPATVMPPGKTRTVVVEDGGLVLGTMSVLTVPYIEAAWINPAHRNGGVARALLRATWALANSDGNAWGFGVAADEAMYRTLTRLGGKPLPASLFILPFARRGR